MKYAIIGDGLHAAELAKRFDRYGIDIGLARGTGPDAIGPFLGNAASHVKVLSLKAALKAKIIILAIPFNEHSSLSRFKPDWTGQIVVDAMTELARPAASGCKPTSSLVEFAFSGAKVVKTFNDVPMHVLADDSEMINTQMVMFLAGNHSDSTRKVGRLIHKLGFVACDLGRLDQGGRLIEGVSFLTQRTFTTQTDDA